MSDVISVSTSALSDIHAVFAKRLSVIAESYEGKDESFTDDPEYSAISVAFSAVGTALDAMYMARIIRRQEAAKAAAI